MQPCSREMQGMNPHQIPLSDHLHQIPTNPHMPPPPPPPHPHHFDPPPPSSSHDDDFLDQMLSTLPSSSSWPLLINPKPFWNDSTDDTNNHNNNNNAAFHFDDHASLASKFRNHQITSTDASNNHSATTTTSSTAALLLQAHQNLLISPDSLLLPGGENSVQALYNGFAGSSVHGSGQIPNQTQQFPNPQGGGNSQPPASSTAAAQPRQRVRARRGQATDPHSIAERLRRERIAERMKALQELVPNANKTDKASMLDEIIDYVKFLQLQVKVLSMSRLGGAAAVAPLVADMASEANTAATAAGGGDCVQATGNGNQTAPSTSNDSITMTEHQVAKLMEEDMGSAMQYLQGKGLCLMPISLATAISTATCHSRGPLLHNAPSSPSMSVLTVQSATAGNGAGDGSVKEVVSVSKA